VTSATSWLRRVRGDPLDWLLKEDNPSVRYCALVDLLEQPADDPKVLAAQQGIPHMRLVQDILGAQWPEGYWMHQGVGYSPKHKATVWQIMFLAQLRIARCGPIERAVEYVLTNSRLRGGQVPGTDVAESRFSARRDASAAVLCLNGNLLRSLSWFGYASDPRVRATRAALAAQVGRDDLRCRFNGRTPAGRRPVLMREGLPCAWGAVKALDALLTVPSGQRTAEEQSAIESCLRLLRRPNLARADYPSSGEVSSLWHQFGFPLGFSSDLLELSDVLLRAGGSAEWLAPAIELLLAKQDAQGRWALEYTPRSKWASFGRRGQPNRWVTFRALRVLRLWGGDADGAGLR